MRKSNNKSNIEGKREKKVKSSSAIKDLDPKKAGANIKGGYGGKLPEKPPSFIEIAPALLKPATL